MRVVICAGLGVGFPGLQFGAGVGAGCGIGIGFGYGLGRGRAHDENGRHSNLGKKGDISAGAEIGAIVDNLFSGLKHAFESFDKELAKRRR
ncbi:hypothetical protein GOP47_0000372 [Adiantum capillus-veneris]|uniref:Uncharacterized protein n=1 Tax=Adiantum capillus-veneris TaxID=13818 RepID=A0A9D4ZQN5_ADICA|nr:hypothetical protein GOP47_0000372 [Adiantum capillus-veneris]